MTGEPGRPTVGGVRRDPARPTVGGVLQDLARPTVGAVLRDLARRPRHYLIARWNWKSAVMSAAIRGVLFFAATVRSGLDAATAAFAIEFAFRGVTSGFFSSVTQAFRRATPDWAATLVVVAGLPFVAHVLEYGIHWAGGTAQLGRAMAASVGFTVLSAAFTLYVMRRGALLVGDEDDRPFRQDLAAMPRLVAGFTAWLARALWRLVTRPVRTASRP